MFWKRKKEKEKTPEERLQFLLSSSPELIAASLAALKAPEFENNTHHLAMVWSNLVYNYAAYAIHLWRSGADPSGEVAKMHAAYRDMIDFLDRNSGQEVRNMALYPWDIVYTLAYLNGTPEEPRFSWANDDFREESSEYDTLSRSLTQRLLGLDGWEAPPPAGPGKRVIAQSFPLYHAILDIGADTPEVEPLVRELEKLWETRAEHASQFHKVPGLLGGGVATDLDVDVHLAGVLHAIDWSGDSIHKWKPEWSAGERKPL